MSGIFRSDMTWEIREKLIKKWPLMKLIKYGEMNAY